MPRKRKRIQPTQTCLITSFINFRTVTGTRIYDFNTDAPIQTIYKAYLDKPQIKPYVQTPFHDKGDFRGSHIFEPIGMDYLERTYPKYHFVPAERNTNKNGQIVGSNSTSNDYNELNEGKRYESKSCAIKWDCGDTKRWYVKFYGATWENFDVLVLVMYSPLGLDIFMYPYHKDEKKIPESYYASCHQYDLHKARLELIEKMKAKGCTYVGLLPFKDEIVQQYATVTTTTYDAYVAHGKNPTYRFCSKMRGEMCAECWQQDRPSGCTPLAEVFAKRRQKAASTHTHTCCAHARA